MESIMQDPKVQTPHEADLARLIVKTLNLDIPASMGVSPKLGLTRYELAQAATGLGRDFRITPLNAAMIVGR